MSEERPPLRIVGPDECPPEPDGDAWLYDEVFQDQELPEERRGGHLRTVLNEPPKD